MQISVVEVQTIEIDIKKIIAANPRMMTKIISEIFLKSDGAILLPFQRRCAGGVGFT